MAVPKKRLGHSAQGTRRANWKAILPSVTTCDMCGAPKLSHKLCGVCGAYKGRIVIKKFQNADSSMMGNAPAADHVHDENCDHDHE